MTSLHAIRSRAAMRRENENVHAPRDGNAVNTQANIFVSVVLVDVRAQYPAAVCLSLSGSGANERANAPLVGCFVVMKAWDWFPNLCHASRSNVMASNSTSPMR